MNSADPTQGQSGGSSLGGSSLGASTGSGSAGTGSIGTGSTGSASTGTGSTGSGSTGGGSTGGSGAGSSGSFGSTTGGSTGGGSSFGGSGGSGTGSSGGMGGELRSNAQQLSSTAGNRIHSELDARKGTAATQAKSVGSAIERAAGELGDDVPQWLRSAFQQGAQQVQRLADTLEQKDSRTIVRDIQQMARQNPGTFLAGCAALGFAAARIFKAGASDGSGTTSFQAPSQTRFPPPQVNEPMFRSSGSDDQGSTSRTGEFV